MYLIQIKLTIHAIHVLKLKVEQNLGWQGKVKEMDKYQWERREKLQGEEGLSWIFEAIYLL